MKKEYFFIILILVIIGAVVYVVSTNSTKHVEIDKSLNSTDINVFSSTRHQDIKNYIIENIPITNNTAKIPVGYNAILNRETAYNSNFPKNLVPSLDKTIRDLKNQLRSDPSLFEVWLDLATSFKTAGDLSGAKLTWEYTSKLQPNNAISFINLANLYAYYLHNNDLAEQNFQKALKNNPNEPNTYYRMAMFYKDVLQDKAKAIAILKQGLKVIPNNLQLTQTLNTI